MTRVLYYTFIICTVAKSLPGACPEDLPVGLSESESDPECKFSCGCGKCDLATYLEKGCPSTDFPFLSRKKLSEREFGLLKVKLWNASQKILESFGSLERNTISMLKEKNIPLDEVTNYVLTIGAMHESVYKGNSPLDTQPLLLQEREKIEMVKDIGSLFLIIKRYYSWFSYGMIEALRKEFLFDEETEHDERLNKYKTDFNDYCRYRMFECPKGMFPNPNCEGFVPLILKVDDFEMYTLNRVEKFQLSIAQILELSKYTLQICDVTDGCVTIVFKIPSWLGDVITISSEQQQKLVQIGVKQLRTGAHSLYDVEVSVKFSCLRLLFMCYIDKKVVFFLRRTTVYLSSSRQWKWLKSKCR